MTGDTVTLVQISFPLWSSLTAASMVTGAIALGYWIAQARVRDHNIPALVYRRMAWRSRSTLWATVSIVTGISALLYV